MRSILIVSPEPESVRMLSLAFELNGWTVHEAADAPDARHIKAENALLIDAIEGASELKNADQWKALKRACGSGCRPIVILPRGMELAEARRRIGDGFLLVRRPYELMQLVKSAGTASAETAPGKKLHKTAKTRKTTARAAPPKRPARRRA